MRTWKDLILWWIDCALTIACSAFACWFGVWLGGNHYWWFPVAMWLIWKIGTVIILVMAFIGGVIVVITKIQRWRNGNET